MTPPDHTTQIQIDKGGQTTQEHLRLAQQNLGEAIRMVRKQQEALRQRGMSVPYGAIDTLTDAELKLGALITEITAGQIELRQLRALAETTALMNSTLGVDEVLRRVMEAVLAMTGAERAFILLRNHEGQMEFRIAQGIDAAALEDADFTISSTIINEVVEHGEAVLTDNAGRDPRYQDQKSVMRAALRSILAVPLRVGGVVTGVVYCDNRIITGLFKAHELNLLQAVANQAAVALENARLFADARARLEEIARLRDVMANVFDSIGSGVITLDLQGQIISFNGAAEIITGQPAHILAGARLADLLVQPLETLPALIERVVRSGQGERWETTITLPERGNRDWQLTITPLRDADRALQGVVIVIDDVTDIRLREGQLRTVRGYLPLALVDNIRSGDLENMGGQEHAISVLFADLRGFTRFSERLEPEQVMLTLNRYLSAATSAIDLYEGVIDKFLGDAITGLFNTPLNPQPDHAERAIRAAQRLLRATTLLNEELPEGERLYFGIGIHSGGAVLGNIGGSERREFTALGDAVEGSRWLQQQARANEVLVSAETAAQVGYEFDFEPVHSASDTPTSLTPYRLLGRKRRTSTIPAVEIDS
jgi:PAS domain S-box-containing protein